MFTESFVEKLKERVNILDVVSNYVKLVHKGRSYLALCPFHAEKTASFNVYPESNSFYCFGCGTGGDIITFIEKAENLNYIEALKFLAEIAGISLNLDSESLKKEQEKSNIKKRILEINRESANFFYRTLWNGSNESNLALNYLKGRRFLKKTLITFGIGYAPENKQLLLEYLKSKGYSSGEIVNANLAYINNRGLESSRFYARIIFPIIDPKGNVVAFGGRVLKEGVNPKYLNTSDTPVFKKSMNLFSLNFVKKEKPKSVILVEGYMDVVALYQNGFKNAVASLGTSLTEYQANIISSLVNEVTICYDSDNAGEKATLRAAQILRNEGLKVKILNVPKGKDPEEFLRISGENANIKFKNMLNKSKNDVEYNLLKEYEKIDSKTSEGKVYYLEKAVKILSQVNNKLEREVYASKISRIMEVNKSTLLGLINKETRKLKKIFIKNQFKEASKRLETNDEKMSLKSSKINIMAFRARLYLCAFIINNPESANNIFLKLPAGGSSLDFSEKIYDLIYKEFKFSGKVSFSNICRYLNESEINKISKYIALVSQEKFTTKDIDNYINIIICDNERLKIENSDSNVLDKEIVTYVTKLRQLKR
jgi:DNA primase